MTSEFKSSTKITPTKTTTTKDTESIDTAKQIVAFVDELVTNAASETQKFIEQKTLEVGETLESITDNSIVRSLKDIFGLDWLTTILGDVEVEKVEARLVKLREKYPHKSSEELAQQIHQLQQQSRLPGHQNKR